jgi:hypothetical protein
MNIDGIAAHGAFHRPLGEVLLILPVKGQGKVFNHRAHEFFDGRFHPAHPIVVARLADARKTHFLVFGYFRCSASQLAVERLPSVDAPQNPTRKQVFFRVSRVATEDAKRHDAKSSTPNGVSLGINRPARKKTASEKNQQPPEIFLGETGGPFAPGRIRDSHPLPGNSTPHLWLQLSIGLSQFPTGQTQLGLPLARPLVSTSLVAFEQLQDCAEATTESIQHEMLM